MATLNEIEARIQEHEKTLIELENRTGHNRDRIRVVNNLISFWKGQKKKLIKSKNL